MKIGYLIVSAVLIAWTTLTGYVILTIPFTFNTPIAEFYTLLILSAFFTSFTISLDLQEKRQNTPLENLPENKKSDHPQRKGTLITIILLIIVSSVYFIIGKHAQQAPEIIPDTYFETTRLNPNLPDEENGLIQFEKIFWTTRSIQEEGESIREKYPYNKRSSFYYNEYDNARRKDWLNKYETLTELLEHNPELYEDLNALEKSDFFEQLETVTALPRQDEEFWLPNSQIQNMERTLANISDYYTQQGRKEEAIKINLLQINLADKYLKSHSSLVQASIAIVNMGIAHTTTKQLLTTSLSNEEKELLLQAYQNTLLTDKETIKKNIFISEYHMYSRLTNGFKFTRNTIQIVHAQDDHQYFYFPEYLQQYAPPVEPFLNTTDTINRLKYWLRILAEGKEIKIDEKTSLPLTLINQKRNLYNTLGDNIVQSLLPRLEWIQSRIDETYTTHQEILQQLQE